MEPKRSVVRLAIVIAPLAVGLIAWACIRGWVVYDDVNARFGESDFVTRASVAALAGCALACALTARHVQGTPLFIFWLVASIGYVYIAADEQFMIHERLDVMINRWLGIDPDNKLADRLDDVIVAAYALPAAAIAWAHRRRLLALTLFVRLMVASAVAFAIMVLLDVAHGAAWTEEGAKIAAEVLQLLAIVAALRDPRLPFVARDDFSHA